MAALLLAGLSVPSGAETIQVSARQVSEFRIGSTETRFGALEFVGGLELTSASRRFGALSSFRFLEPGGRFVGVADTGNWFFGRVVHSLDGTPTGVADFTMEPMVDKAGRPVTAKRKVDAEGLAVNDGVATVGFEREHRIAQFRIAPGRMKPAFRTLPFLVPSNELRINRGFETVVHTQPHGPHEGALVIVSEKSLDKHGNIFAAIIEGPGKGIFTVKRSGDYDITDGAILSDGDLLLLERSYSMLTGVRMRLRRIDGESIAKGAVADGPVLLEADMGDQIDNMEALDVWRRSDGAEMVSLLSDDNLSMLQRSLYLEFRLIGD